VAGEMLTFGTEALRPSRSEEFVPPWLTVAGSSRSWQIKEPSRAPLSISWLSHLYYSSSILARLTIQGALLAAYIWGDAQGVVDARVNCTAAHKRANPREMY
jgi:hypothetical protein